MATPSSRRREGRMAFYLGGDPQDNRYVKYKAWGWESKSRDYVDGWNEAAADHEREEAKVCSTCGGSVDG